jgi:hypothetical protein
MGLLPEKNMSNILGLVAKNDADVARLEKELTQAKVDRRVLHEKALKEICPFAALQRNEVFIPIGATQAIVNATLSVQPPHTPGGPYRWEARGKQVRFRLGVMESVREGSIDQPAYEALPEEVRALTLADMVENTKQQALTGVNKPLKLTERQLSMFAGLGNNNERLKFNTQGVEGGQRLPSAIWDSQSSTQQIWRTLIKRGVLTLVSGNAEHTHSSWMVNPGPRFEEAVSLLLDTDVLKRGSIAYDHAHNAFRPGQAKPSAPARRLR